MPKTPQYVKCDQRKLSQGCGMQQVIGLSYGSFFIFVDENNFATQPHIIIMWAAGDPTSPFPTIPMFSIIS